MRTFRIELVFLPRYSPELNPIEEAFNKLKTILLQDFYHPIINDSVAVAVETITTITAHDTIEFAEIPITLEYVYTNLLVQERR